MVFTTESEVFFNDTNNASGIQDDSLISGIGLDLMGSASSSGSSPMLAQLELNEYIDNSEASWFGEIEDADSNEIISGSGNNILPNELDIRSSLMDTTAEGDRLCGKSEDDLMNGGLVDDIVTDDTLDTATAFGTLGSTPRSTENEVSNADLLDNYSFSIDAPSEVEITLSGLSADADVYLVSDENRNGVVDENETIEVSALDGNETEVISAILDAGEYFIQVEQFEGDTSYTLEVQATRFTVPADEAGDSFETAFDLNGLETAHTVNEFVGDLDLEDYYRIEVDRPTNIDVTLGGLTNDVDLYLVEDANGDGELQDAEYLLESINVGTEADNIATTLFPGEYFLLVASIEGNTNYTLDAVASPFYLALQSNPTPNSTTGFVGVTHPVETYQFTLTESSLVQLDLTNLNADVDLALFADADGNLGEELALSEAAGIEAEQILEELEPGTYYVQVQQFEGDTQYSLALQSTPGATAPPDPEDLSDAVDLDILTESISVSDAVNESMPFDTYRFEIDTTSQVQLGLTNLTADADLFLYQDLNDDLQLDLDDFEDPELVDFSEEVEDADETLNLILEPGVYYARVAQYEPSDETDYTFSLSASPFTPPQDSVGDSTATALDLGVLQAEYSTTEFVGEIDQQDFYQFTLEEASNITLALEGLGADADLYLYQDGEEIAFSESVGSEDELIGLEDVAAGIYTVEVSQFAGNTNYTLALTQENFVPEGQLSVISNSFRRVTGPNSTRLELSQTPRTFTDKVTAGTNPKDYFAFTLTGQAKDFNATLTGLNADADLRLYQDKNNNGEIDADERLVTSNNSGTDDEQITRATLDPGTYIVEVSAYQNAVTDYRLSVSGTPPQPQVVLPAITAEGITRNGNVTAAEPLDFYRFTAANDLTNFRANLSGLAADVDLLLYRDENQNGIADEQALRKSEQGGNADEAIALDTLAAGQYLIGVRGYQGAESNYTLTVAGTPPAPAPTPTPTPTPTPQLPNSLPTITPDGVTRNSNVTEAKPQDFYPFTANNDLVNFQAALTGLTGDADLILYRDNNQNGIGEEAERLEQSNKSGTQNEFITRNPLPAGQYVLGVRRFGGLTSGVGNAPVVNYRLVVSGGVPNPAPVTAVNAGISIQTAPEIRAIAQQLQGNVSDASPDAFYRINVTEPGIFTANLSGLTGDADVRLINDRNNNNAIDPVSRDANGYLRADRVEVIAWPGDRGTNNERLRAFLQPGTYYLNVNSYNKSTTPYTVTTGFTAAEKDPFAVKVELDFQGNLPQDAKDAVQAVADYWSTIVPYTTLPSAQTIKITVDGKDQGGRDAKGSITLASAGPNKFAKDARGIDMPLGGTFDINTNPEATKGLGLGTGTDRDLRAFFDTAFHEIGHVFTAIATRDDVDATRQFIDKGTKADDAFYIFDGNAKLAYGELLGTFQPTNVPVTKGRGEGSDFAHWQQETFGNDIFTHTDGPGDKDYLSILSIAYLKDYGFNVNYGAAEPFDLTKAQINRGNG